MSEEARVEQLIQETGATAPRVTPGDLDQVMAESRVQYHIFPDTTVTVCCVTLPNGFNVVGKSAAVSPENFNKEVGEVVALNNARSQLWELLGFQLKGRV